MKEQYACDSCAYAKKVQGRDDNNKVLDVVSCMYLGDVLDIQPVECDKHKPVFNLNEVVRK